LIQAEVFSAAGTLLLLSNFVGIAALAGLHAVDELLSHVTAGVSLTLGSEHEGA